MKNMMNTLSCFLVLFLLVPLTAQAQGTMAEGAMATGVAAEVMTNAVAPGTPAAAPAATTAPGTPEAAAAVGAGAAATPSVPPVDLNAPFNESFLFTPAEIVAIRRAAEGTVMGSAVLGADSVTSIPVRRVIALSGIVLRAPGDWIVWLNGKKMTPKDLLPEVMDISVQRDRVHLKWFDIGLNNIISITLRPHQTYDIVTGVLLPG